MSKKTLTVLLIISTELILCARIDSNATNKDNTVRQQREPNIVIDRIFLALKAAELDSGGSLKLSWVFFALLYHNLRKKNGVNQTNDGDTLHLDDILKYNLSDRSLNLPVISDRSFMGEESRKTIVKNEIPGDEVQWNKSNDQQCVKSKTTRNRLKTCKGDIIFEENFSNSALDERVWLIEQRLPSADMENEFVSYQRTIPRIVNKTLHIAPKLLHMTPRFNEDSIEFGKLDLLIGCTAAERKYCIVDTRHPQTLLPPVVSGKITTKHSFRFKYGKVEISAKLPLGDWMYPIIHLEPFEHYYGFNYDSGIIRVAFARGNEILQDGIQSHDNTILSGGVLLNQFDPCRSYNIDTKSKMAEPLGNKFHVYGLTWNESEIVLTLDNVEYGRISPKYGFKRYNMECKEIDSSLWPSQMSPFDREFYITIGVGVGGVSDFPDADTKPWSNLSPDARFKFWDGWRDWYATWSNESVMMVDWIKVWAL